VPEEQAPYNWIDHIGIDKFMKRILARDPQDTTEFKDAVEAELRILSGKEGE
jgi:hypothetical protein